MWKNRRNDEGEGGRGGVEPFQGFKNDKVTLLNMKRSKCLKMCYSSRDIIVMRGKKITHSICEGWQVFKLHWRHFPKSAEVGRRHGAVQCKAATGFVPVHCCRSPRIHLIQSQRHQMPWECQTQSLKRQPAQRKKHKQHSNNRGYNRGYRLWKNLKMEKMGRMKKKDLTYELTV